MDITVHASFLPHDAPDASLAFGFEAHDDVGHGGNPGAAMSGLPFRP